MYWCNRRIYWRGQHIFYNNILKANQFLFLYTLVGTVINPRSLQRPTGSNNKRFGSREAKTFHMTNYWFWESFNQSFLIVESFQIENWSKILVERTNLRSLFLKTLSPLIAADQVGSTSDADSKDLSSSFLNIMDVTSKGNLLIKSLTLDATRLTPITHNNE